MGLYDKQVLRSARFNLLSGRFSYVPFQSAKCFLIGNPLLAFLDNLGAVDEAAPSEVRFRSRNPCSGGPNHVVGPPERRFVCWTQTRSCRQAGAGDILTIAKSHIYHLSV